MSGETFQLVHGLGGHPKGTWSTDTWKRDPDTPPSVFRRKDLLPQNIKNARMATIQIWDAINRTNAFQHEDLLIAERCHHVSRIGRPSVALQIPQPRWVKDVLPPRALSLTYFRSSSSPTRERELVDVHKATYGWGATGLRLPKRCLR